MNETYYAHCNCNIWPLFYAANVGRCGRCRVRPFSNYYQTREEAVAAFKEWKKG